VIINEPLRPPSGSELDSAGSELDSAGSELDSAGSELDSAGSELDSAELLADEEVASESSPQDAASIPKAANRATTRSLVLRGKRLVSFMLGKLKADYDEIT
jgi:hypothetical protein